MSFWKSVDLKKLLIPENVKNKSNSLLKYEGHQDVNGINVFYRKRCLPDDQLNSISLLLLHGIRFSSKTWLDLGTIDILASCGYCAIAIDIPGYGESSSATIDDRAQFLKQLLDAFNLKKTVIISPSMSGFYTLPYIIKHPDALSGYVPVAPVGIEVLEALPAISRNIDQKEMHEPLKKFYTKPMPDLSFITTPTMVVYGEKDRSRSSALLSLLPNSQCQEIPNGGHPAYLDDPDLWHKLLYNFLKNIEEQS